MLPERRIDDIAREVAKANLREKFLSVLSSPSVDSTGDPALRITITVKADTAEEISGEEALNTLTELQRRLQEGGDDRFPIIEYTTRKELEGAGS